MEFKEKFLATCATGKDGVLFVDFETGKILDFNDAALGLYLYDRNEFGSLVFSDICPEPGEILARLSNWDVAENLTFAMENQLRNDGKTFPADISIGFFMLNGRGTLCATVHDLSERKRMEDRLTLSNNRLDLIINSFNGFIFTVSNEYKIEFINTAMIEKLGYDATGEHCFEAIHGLSEKCPWCMGATVFSGEPASFEQKNLKDKRWYHYVSTPRFDGDGKVTAQQFVAIDIDERKVTEEALKKSKDDLQAENKRLKAASINRHGLDKLVGHTLQMQEVYNLILEVASSDASVLIYGESGTGKELVSNAIHNLGERKERVFLPVNCGGIPETLIESEFFGYKKGAFTGANIDKAGFLEIADRGTLFLDEIGDISLGMQVKLLRALDGDGYTPIGSGSTLKHDIRIISATNRDLDSLVQNGLMREDFFYRINVVPIHLPPLRKRRADIPVLVYHFLKMFCKDKTLPHISPEIMDRFESYDWPGNVRELQNIIHRYVALKRVDVFDFLVDKGERKMRMDVEPPSGGPCPNLRHAVAAYEKKMIALCLKENLWKQGKVASILGMNRKTLYSKIKKYDIRIS